jgi:hypothetical protein
MREHVEVVNRRSLLGLIGALSGSLLLFSVAVVTGRVQLWRYINVKDKQQLTVENYDNSNRTVTVRITAKRNNELVFADSFNLPSGEQHRPTRKTTDEPVFREVGRYRLEAELDDGTTKAVVIEPLSVQMGTKMPKPGVKIDWQDRDIHILATGGKP